MHPVIIKKAYNPSSGKHRRQGNSYVLTAEEIAHYNEKGYLILDDVLTEAEMSTLDPWFEHFITGKEPGMERDFCDMSQPYGTPMEEFRLVNAMLPSKYRHELVGNIFFQVAQHIADQLYPQGKAVMDYEQFLAKKPQKELAEFAMHQDLGYWPKTKNTWTATFSLAMNDADVDNGCLQVVPGSNKEPGLRRHRPKDYGAADAAANRDASHTLVIDMYEHDDILYLPVRRGSLTIHDERIVHGSAGNLTHDWRKTYVMAFRDADTVAQERAMGFTHSHNDQVDWESVLRF